MSPQGFALIFALAVLIVPLSGWAVSVLILLPSIRPRDTCPHCGTSQIRHSRPVAFDRMVPWLRPFKCKACLRRFYLWRRAEKRQRAASA